MLLIMVGNINAVNDKFVARETRMKKPERDRR